MLGTAIKEVFNDHHLLLTSRDNLDITKIKQVMSWTGKKPKAILHLAAETDLKKAEANPKSAHKINHLGTKNIVYLAQKLNVPIITISSGMVFNGKKKSYSEKDKPHPKNVYGKSKHKSEIATRAHKKHYIVRAGWAFGGGRVIDKKFVNKIYEQISSGAKKLYGITDIYGNPTYTIDFAKTLKNLVEGNASYGTYNSGGKGIASRYDVLKEFVRLLGLSKKIETIPVTVNEYQKFFPSPFPYITREVLAIDKLEATGLSAMRDWRDALAEYALEFKS